MKNNKKLNPRANIQRSDPHHTLTPFSFDSTQQLFARPSSIPSNVSMTTHSIPRFNIRQSNVPVYQNSVPLSQQTKNQIQHGSQCLNANIPINGAHQTGYAGPYTHPNNQHMPYSSSQMYDHSHKNEYHDNQSCDGLDEDNPTQNIISMMANLANSIYETAKSANRSRGGAEGDQQYQPRLKQRKHKPRYSSPPKTEHVAITLISSHAEMQCKQRKRKYRNEYVVNYTVSAIRSDNMELHSQKQGTFNAGFIDPHLPKTINAITQEISRLYANPVTYIVDAAQINDVKWKVDVSITCLVPPIQLPPQLQCSFISLDQGIAKGLRIQQGDIQIKWDRDIDICNVNFEEDVLIEGYAVELIDKLRKQSHVIFRSMQFQNKSQKGFLQFVRKHSPGLPLGKLVGCMYDEHFNVGVLSF